MSFEFKPFSKKEGIPVEREDNEKQIIDSVLHEIKAEGMTQTEVFKKPQELNPGQPRHQVFNEPRLMQKPEFTQSISPETVAPKNPPTTM
ncbi:MAG: hypothetical protein V4606_01690 [Patescibacteria group bacterium]